MINAAQGDCNKDTNAMCGSPGPHPLPRQAESGYRWDPSSPLKVCASRNTRQYGWDYTVILPLLSVTSCFFRSYNSSLSSSSSSSLSSPSETASYDENVEANEELPGQSVFQPASGVDCTYRLLSCLPRPAASAASAQS